MAFPVRNKNAIVTGGASGINLAFTRLLVRHGANVVVADLQSSAALEELQQQQKGSTKVLFHNTDVSSFASLESLFSYTKSALGSVDILCNGAGVYEPTWSNFWTDTETDGYKSLEINVSGLIKGTRMAIRDQITRSKGHSSTNSGTTGVIINISSLAARGPLFNQPLYCTSKAAVSMFTKSLAPLHKEFGIKVVAVAPGMTMTPLWSDHPEKMKAISPDDALSSPQEIAQGMLDLIEDGNYEGGTILEVLKGSTQRAPDDSNLPVGPGSTVGNMHLIYSDTMKLLEGERNAGTS